MAITIKLVKSNNELALAQRLVKETYQKSFNLDIDKLHRFHPEKFESDVLLAIYNDCIMGTMSVMYPNEKGKFPCEALFGFHLENFGFSANNYIEIGRFATSEEGKKNKAVVIALFLGAIKFLQNNHINGWAATVKSDVYGFLNNLNLPIHNIKQRPILKKNDPLKNYVGKDSELHLFDVSIEETANSFQRFNGYLERGLIEINF